MTCCFHITNVPKRDWSDAHGQDSPYLFSPMAKNKNPNQPSESATCVGKSVQPEHGSWAKMSSKRDSWQSFATSNSCSNCRLFERHHFLSNQDRLRQRCKAMALRRCLHRCLWLWGSLCCFVDWKVLHVSKAPRVVVISRASWLEMVESINAHRYPPRTLDKGQGKQRVEAEAEGQWAEAEGWAEPQGQWAEAEGEWAEVWAEAEGQANSSVDKGISATRWAFDSQRSFWESCDLCVWGAANEGRLQLCCGFGQVEQEPLCRKVIKNHFRCHAQLCWQACSQEESRRCVERTVSYHSRGSLEWRRSENFEVTICSIFGCVSSLISRSTFSEQCWTNAGECEK